MSEVISTGTPRVVIVGGGFGGLYAARTLGDQPVKVTVIDRQNYHLFQPLLYQVATAGLSPAEIASPIRQLVNEHPNIEVKLGEVSQVSLKDKQLQVREISGETELVPYDYLVLATGVRHSYFGHDEWEPFAPGLKSLDDALEIRRRVLLAFERAETVNDEAERARLLTFVVVGGGPTGVELAGALAELSRFTVAKDFRAIDPTRAKVVLIEAGPRLLATFDPKLSEAALASLHHLGVDVKLNTRVSHVSGDGVRFLPGPGQPEQVLAARTVVWGAGVAGGGLAKTLGVELDRAGRVKVGLDCAIPGHPEAFVIGDLGCFTPEGETQPLPGLAPVAIQQGKFVGKQILGSSEGRHREKFEYVDKGTMATIGRASGIAQSGPLKLTGFIGWLAWLFIHILYLIGFRNRLVVMFQWAWAWFTFQRGSRLITGVSPGTPTLPPR